MGLKPALFICPLISYIMSTMKIINFLLLLMAFCSFQASAEQILSCVRPVHLDDPNFIQGSEMYFDIFLNDESGIEVTLTMGSLKSEVFLDEGIEKKFKLNESLRTLMVEWDRPSKIALVLRQMGKNWVGGLWFSEGLKTALANVPAGRDIELKCVGKGRLKD